MLTWFSAYVKGAEGGPTRRVRRIPIGEQLPMFHNPVDVGGDRTTISVVLMGEGFRVSIIQQDEPNSSGGD